MRAAAVWVASALWLGACGEGVLDASKDEGQGSDNPTCIARHSQALNACAQSDEHLRGIDISAWQGAVDWTAIKNDGVSFAVVRVSDGLAYPDKYFVANWKGMKAEGVVRGVYQFFRPKDDPIAQAELLLAKLEEAGGLEDTDLPPVLDLEDDDGVSAALYQERALVWIKYIEEKTGRTPIVYSAAFFSKFTGKAFSDYPLWVANYKASTMSCPVMPDGWSKWAIWQWTDKGTVAGISGGVDENIFDGSRADLDAFIRGSLRNPADPNTRDAGIDEADAGMGANDADGGTTPTDPAPEPSEPDEMAPGAGMGAGQECDDLGPDEVDDEMVDRPDAGLSDPTDAATDECANAGQPAEIVANDPAYFCKEGFSYDRTYHLCVDATQALGPFSPAMIASCERCGGVGCADPSWPVEQARAARGTGACMPGTTANDRGLCVDEKSAFGPFSPAHVQACLAEGGGEGACRSMRWGRDFAERISPSGVGVGGTGERAWGYILQTNWGIRDDSAGAGHFGAARSGNAGGHSGIDFLAPVGTALFAPCEGNAVSGVASGYGSYVQLVCALPASFAGGKNLWASMFFAHLSKIDIAASARVKRGQRVGAVGKTGNAASASIGPHVHFEIAIHGSESAAFSESHASSNHAANTASGEFSTRFEQSCLLPNAFKPRTGPSMKGRRPDPFMLLACVSERPAFTAPPASLQGHSVTWSTHYDASFDVDDAS